MSALDIGQLPELLMYSALKIRLHMHTRHLKHSTVHKGFTSEKKS